MPKWTEHTKYTFHIETNDSTEYVARTVESMTSFCTMVSEYNGAWAGQVSRGIKIEWIAPADGTDHSDDVLFLSTAIKGFWHATCLMMTRETVELFCECR